jgi:uncharacterized protein (DUF433 family)
MQLEDYFDFLGPNEIKIKGHRVWMEHILDEYLDRAKTLEELVARFDTLTKEQILAALLYYHNNKEAMDRYMAAHREYCRKSREEDERRPPEWYAQMRRLLAERKAKGRIDVTCPDCLTRGWLQEHRFTSDAIRVLDDADERASARGMLGELPDALVLWAMLRWERKVGVTALAACGVDLGSLEKTVDEGLQTQRGFSHPLTIDYTGIGNIAIWAVEEAKGLGHQYVGTEHLLLALCRSSHPLTVSVFRKCRITPEVYRPKLMELLSGHC